MIIRSDNPATQKALTKLIETMLARGAWFHKDMALTSENNGLLVELDGPCNPSDTVITVPISQLVPATSLNIMLEGNDFVISPDEDRLTPLQIELANQMFEIYNLTGRSTFHAGEYVWVRYREAPDLLEYLLEARTLTHDQKDRLNFTRQGEGCADEASFICDTFWQTRVVGSKVEQNGPVEQMLMPFVDCLDHHPAGSPYSFPARAKGEVPVLSILNRQPFLSTSTLFACYNLHDALDTFIYYGFIDAEARLVRAVPMTIDLSDGKRLEISSLSTKVKEPLTDSLKDLQAYSPKVMIDLDDKNKLLVSHLLIPILDAPHSLRRILKTIIHAAFREDRKSPQYIIELTYRTEREVVENTIAFYKDTLVRLQSLDDAPVDLLADAVRLCKVQLAKLYKYGYNENFFTTQ